MADPITIGFILTKLFTLIKIGAAAYLVVRILKFERIKNWIISRWEQYSKNPNVWAFWLKKKIENKDYAERDLHIWGFLEKMTLEVLEWEAALPDSIDEEMGHATSEEDVVYFHPAGS
jgi:hypothetical protein